MPPPIPNKGNPKYACMAAAAILLFLLASISTLAKDPVRKNNIPYMVPSTNVEPSIPEWPKAIVKMYDTTTILFIGDIMQHTPQIKSAYIQGMDPMHPFSYDYSHTFRYIRNKLIAADISVANVEFPVGTPPYSGYPRFSAPESIITEASKSGITLFQIANNHLMDKGRRGIENTLNIYDSLKVHYTGAYRNDSTERATNPKIINVNGLKIAFINFTYGTNGIPTPTPYIINMMDSIKIKAAIHRAKENNANMIIALPHWGNEYQIYPSEEQKKWAKMLFNNGVNIIVGTHPHVPQSVELYLNNTINPRRYGVIKRMVFYSLGNFISNQSNPSHTQLGMLVRVKIVKNNISGEVSLCRPDIEYLWCFKKGEMERDYTVVPIEDILNDIELQRKIKDKNQLHRMMETYKFILDKKFVKEL